MLMQNFGVTKKEHYSMLWYFLEWSIRREREEEAKLCDKRDNSLFEKTFREPSPSFTHLFLQKSRKHKCYEKITMSPSSIISAGYKTRK